VALRAQPRPVTRLNRRTLAILVGGLSVAVLGATIWSLQPQRRGAGEQTELYNVDRVSKSEGLDGLPADYSKLPPKVPELGPPLPGDLGPAIVKSQQPVTPPTRPRPRPERCAAQGGRSGGGFVGVLPLGQPEGRAGGAAGAAAPGFAANAASTRWRPGRPRRRPSPPTRPPCRTGKTRKRRS
jgi:type IV secretion system protein VirB10